MTTDNGASRAIQPATRAQILDAAREAVMVDRAATHGAVENSFGQLAAVWSARLGLTVTPAQVALMLVDLKVTRAWGNPGHADNWVDIAGYGACGGELAREGDRALREAVARAMAFRPVDADLVDIHG